jgi:DNA-directed RNA polymerase subunit RPC12/RpoP
MSWSSFYLLRIGLALSIPFIYWIDTLLAKAGLPSPLPDLIALILFAGLFYAVFIRPWPRRSQPIWYRCPACDARLGNIEYRSAIMNNGVATCPRCKTKLVFPSSHEYSDELPQPAQPARSPEKPPEYYCPDCDARIVYRNYRSALANNRTFHCPNCGRELTLPSSSEHGDELPKPPDYHCPACQAQLSDAEYQYAKAHNGFGLCPGCGKKLRYPV